MRYKDTKVEVSKVRAISFRRCKVTHFCGIFAKKGVSDCKFNRFFDNMLSFSPPKCPLFWGDIPKPERLTRLQAGVSPPVIYGPNIMSAEGTQDFFYYCENGLVSRFNSEDLAGKCAAFNRQQKIAIAENNCSSILMNLGPDGFSARSAIFCRYWTCSFSGRNNQAIEAEVVCHFHLTCVSVSVFDFQMGLLLLSTTLYSKDVGVTC